MKENNIDRNVDGNQKNDKVSNIELIVKGLLSVGLLLITVGLGSVLFTELQNDESAILLIGGIFSVWIFIVLIAKNYINLVSLK